MIDPELLLQQNVSLAKFTTLGLGGSARYFAECRSDDEIAAVIRLAQQRGIPLHVLGGGSNTIFLDEGFDGIVLRVSTQGVTVVQDGGATLVTVAAGEDWDRVVEVSVGQGLAGIECLSGIPGSAGATPIQNVGAYGQEVKDVITEVECLERQSGSIVRMSTEACGFGYRTSTFKQDAMDRFVVLRVRMRLTPKGLPTVRYAELERALQGMPLPAGSAGLTAVRKVILGIRRKKSMIHDPADPHTRSVGSFFMNPLLDAEDIRRLQQVLPGERIPTFDVGGRAKVAAAWLVEHAGFVRGYRRGGVGISQHHALALVNYEGTTGELLALAQEIEDGVESRFGVRLEREPVVVPLHGLPSPGESS